MKITLSTLSTKALATFAERTINSSQSGRYTVVEGQPLLKKVINEFNIYKQVYGKLTYSGKGKDIAKLDQERDAAISAFRNYLKATAGLQKAPGHAEAVAIYDIFKNLGDSITSMNYAEETAQLHKLFMEMDKPEIAAKLHTMNMAEVYADIRQKQQDFEASYAAQTEANTELRSLPSATAIRTRLEKALRKYLDLLTSMRDEEGWEKIYLEISEIAKGVRTAGSSAEPDAAQHE